MKVKGATKQKLITVPITPKRKIYNKYLKKNFFLKLYPAPNIIGGRMRVKKTSESNPRDFAKLAFV